MASTKKFVKQEIKQEGKQQIVNKQQVKEVKQEAKQEVKQVRPKQENKNNEELEVKIKDKNEIKKNALTSNAKLELNVNDFKRWLIKYYDNNDMKFIGFKKDDKDPSIKIEELQSPMFKGFHVILALIIENCFKKIITTAANIMHKQTSGLISITSASIKYLIMQVKDLKFTFEEYLEHYEQKMMYADSFCIDKKIMYKFINQIGNSINLEPEGYGFLSYLMLRLMTDYAKYGYFIARYANKKSLDIKLAKTITELKFSGELHNDLIRKIDDTDRILSEFRSEETKLKSKNLVNQNEENGENEENIEYEETEENIEYEENEENDEYEQVIDDEQIEEQIEEEPEEEEPKPIIKKNVQNNKKQNQKSLK